jgi:hypothetical protein
MMEFWNIGIMGSKIMEWWVWRIKKNMKIDFPAIVCS